MYHVIAKGQLPGKLVQKLVSEVEESRFRALEIQNFTGGACTQSPQGSSWLRHSMFAPPPNIQLCTYLPHCLA